MYCLFQASSLFPSHHVLSTNAFFSYNACYMPRQCNDLRFHHNKLRTDKIMTSPVKKEPSLLCYKQQAVLWTVTVLHISQQKGRCVEAIRSSALRPAHLLQAWIGIPLSSNVTQAKLAWACLTEGTWQTYRTNAHRRTEDWRNFLHLTFARMWLVGSGGCQGPYAWNPVPARYSHQLPHWHAAWPAANLSCVNKVNRTHTHKHTLRGLSPQANYIDRATATCRRG
jgi:hypothetical protein